MRKNGSILLPALLLFCMLFCVAVPSVMGQSSAAELRRKAQEAREEAMKKKDPNAKTAEELRKEALDSLQTPKVITKIVEKPRIAGIRIGTDLSRFAMPLLDPAVQAAEFTAELLINNRIFVVAEAGWSDSKRAGLISGNFIYGNSGTYYRFGADYNLFFPKTRQDAFFVGARYGISSFKHDLLYARTDRYWRDAITGFDRVEELIETGLRANWIEGVAGIKVKIWKQFYAGSLIRIRSFLSQPPQGAFSVMDIPGWGFNHRQRPVRFDFGLQIAYRIPFGKPKDPPQPKGDNWWDEFEKLGQ